MVEDQAFFVVISVEPIGLFEAVWFWEMNTTPMVHSIHSRSFMQFIDALETPMVIASNCGQIRCLNKAFAQWLGYEKEEMMGAPLSQFMAEGTLFSEFTTPKLMTFRSFSGHQRPGVLNQMYPLDDKKESVCLVIQPQLVSPEEIKHLATLLDAMPFPGVFIDHRGMVRLANRAF
jgi:transcriptional regulator of aromatic amino acid metabolism